VYPLAAMSPVETLTRVFTIINSTGKSTIVDFIFYALGGEVTAWTLEATRCDAVFMEVSINDTPVTIRREVSDAKAQKMAIFFGTFDQSRASVTEGWSIYPFARTRDTESFSQVLFRSLGIPEVSADESRSLTMHQLLRLIVVDQMSSVDSLLREENFDSAIVRRAVGDVLFGIYDNNLYANEVVLRDKKTALDDVEKQINNLIEVLGSVGQTRTSADFDKQILYAYMGNLLLGLCSRGWLLWRRLLPSRRASDRVD
jgi:hypothetical protein